MEHEKETRTIKIRMWLLRLEKQTAPRDQNLVNNGKDEHASLSEAVVNSNGDKKLPTLNLQIHDERIAG